MRRWEMAAAGVELVRAEGALQIQGLSSFSVFFRRASQSSGATFELTLWTTPIFFRPLDDDFQSTPTQYLRQITMDPVDPIPLAGQGTGAQVFGGKVKEGQPVGTLLFWQMKNAGGASASIVGDIYVVPNSIVVVTTPRISRTLDVSTASSFQGTVNRTLK